MEPSTLAPLTADEFVHHPAAQEASELVRGAIVMTTPAGGRHNVVAGRLSARLSTFVEDHALGMVFSDNLGYDLPIPGATRDTVRSPDASFVRAERLPGGEGPIGFLRCAPDLAVEVLSPDDRPGELAARMRAYFAAGPPRMWVVDPDARTVTAHALDGPLRSVSAKGSLEGGPLLPGFTMPVAPLFSRLPRRR